MRIIDKKNHDYYDCIQRYGQDDTCIFLRKREEIPSSIKIHELFGSRFHINYVSTKFKDIYTHIIGFCGELYPLVSSLGEDYVYSFEEFEQQNYSLNRYDKEFIKDWFEFKPKEIMDLFRKHHCPHFMIKGYKGYNHQYLSINESLQDFNFQKVKDPYTAFHDIHNYLSGVLGVTQELPEASNDIKIEQHGFDLKESFRTPKGRKPNRKGR
jgi:hypothetical protein